ncbi:hypothetical protein [Pseudomonas syringae]|uniref:hypothetical protein n=1 Tax=Pseudomonas syringae TaxID=317 RepID=UPI003F75702D
MTKVVTQSEIVALDLAFRCLAASLKHAGSLQEELYVGRLEAAMVADYPVAESKEIFNLKLQSYIDDIARVKGPTD